jgi:hypothetical protein
MKKRKKVNPKKLSKRIVTLSVVGAVIAVLVIIGFKSLDLAVAEGLLSRLTAAAGDSQNWRSKLYPEDWQPATPDRDGRFLHDFSYAGYMRGEEKIPSNVSGNLFDVTKIPYNADKKGEKDATRAIQKAIDDAEAAGGGIVYLPAGTYKISVQSDSDTSVLKITESNVVLRGDGPGQTYLFNKTTNMRGKSVIRVQSNKDAIMTENPAKSSKVTKNYKLPTTEIEVADASKFKVDDWVSVTSTLTAEWISEMGMSKLWTPKADWQAYTRKVIAVDTAKKTITIDIPTRYELLTKRDARVYVIKDPIERVGIEKLSFGNEKNPKSGWEFDDYENKNTGAYQVDMSEYFRFNHVANAWMKQVESYEPPKNGGVHTLSTAIVLDEYARRMTLTDVSVRNPQYKGGGGNGYGIQIFGGDNLVENCTISNGRHNAVLSGPVATGNVFTDCTLRGGTEPSETHGRFSVSNLFDNITLAGGEKLTSEDRGDAGNSNQGLTSSETVFWNITGSGTVTSQQYKVGYVIGTGPNIKINLQGNGGNLTGPSDYVEGNNRASTLRPQSLYRNQLARRLEGKTVPASISAETPLSQATSTAATTTSPTPTTPAEEPGTTPPASQSQTPAPSTPQARSMTFSTPGTHTFTVPAYVSTLKVEVWGAGGGGGSNADDKKASGENGSSSSFDKVIARGGKGGDGGVRNQAVSGGNGGTAEGGDDNRTGDNGKNGNANGAGNGGSSPKGGAGGNGADTPKNTTAIPGKDGAAPGGGGGGTAKMLSGGGYNNGAGGGGGGYATKTYAKGTLAPGKTITVVVGEGGKGAKENVNGGNGAHGEVRISWTE